MQVTSALANGLWAASALPVWTRYRRWLQDPARQQAARLLRYVRDNRETAFGRAHGFDRIDSMRAYQARVPIRTYDELSPFVERIAAGEPHVLTREPVRRLAFTSGSTAAAKLVPYTRTLTQEMTRGASIWIADLFRAHPSLVGGPAYWSITPIGQQQRQRQLSIAAAAKIPVGFDDDTEYLGAISRRLAAAALAVPSDVRAIEDLDTCRYVTLHCLLRATDLRLVSVWHPSFLTLLLDAMESWWPALLDDLARGTLTPSSPLPASLAARLRARLPPDPRRADALGRIGPRDVCAIWPALGLVSCWTDGPARLHAADLERRLAGIRVQPKGLLATEAFITLPFGDSGARPLALPCHVFELLGDDGRVVLPHDAERDAVYSIIVTTGGGFYRYRLQDRVRVTGWVGRTPSLTFLGKEDAISDLVGEKLSEGFVTAVVQQVCAAHGITPRFALLAPEEEQTRAAYTLFLDADADAGTDTRVVSAAIASTLETRLRENPHYAYAVDLGQLAPARVVSVDRGAQAAYLARRAADGVRVGDIKPASLSPQRGWASVLVGRS